ncbi:MAG: tetratricopeptide repeat protein [Bacteroidetes bacterium]|nr:tetratricopeptide repeat protein [Bacteroidota bacterium]
MQDLTRGLFLSVLFFCSANGLSQNTESGIPSSFQHLNPDDRYDTLISLSKLFSFDNPDTALFFAEIAFFIASEKENDFLIADAAYFVAEAYTNGSKFREAIDYYRISAEAEYRIKNDSTGFFAERLSDIAYCYQELGIYEKSLELYQHSLKLQLRFNNMEEVATILSNIGSNLFLQGDYEGSLILLLYKMPRKL